MPGKPFFIDRSPHQAETCREEAQQTCCLTETALLAIRRAAIEIHQPETGKTHPGRIAIGQTPQSPVEQRQHRRNANQEWSILFREYEITARKVKDCQEHPHRDQHHTGVESRRDEAMQRRGDRRVTIDYRWRS